MNNIGWACSTAYNFCNGFACHKVVLIEYRYGKC